jgi:hypothetical protein
MTISPLTSTNAGTSTASTASATQTATQATSSTNPVAQALKKADVRLQTQLDTANTQLSTFGKLKAAVSDAQLAGRALGSLSATSTTTEVKTAANKLITALNAAIGRAQSAAASLGSAESGSAKRVSHDLGRAVTANPSTFDALKKIGFKQQSDGSFTLDAAKFDAAQKADPAAVQSAMTKLGQAVDKVAAKELASGGNVAGPMAALGQRSTALKTQQSAMLAMVQNFATTATTSATQSASYVSASLSAYTSNAA